MVKIFFSRICKNIKNRLADRCRSLSEEMCSVIILIMVLVLGGGSIISIVHSMYHFNKKTTGTQMPKIEAIKRLELSEKDSLKNNYNFKKYESDREFTTEPEK
ncbi:MAG: TraL conjugative transposon family protein [Bacteroidales bacterium]|nr:TraL conjugative transposon family protein [Bacteroidales bacterium]